MSKYASLLLIILCSLLLIGCWDSRLLGEHSLILAIGYDLTDDEKIVKTVTFPEEMTGEKESTEEVEDSKVITIEGDTVKATDIKLDQLLPQQFDRSKAQIILLGEDLAKNGVFTTLDSIYRDLRGPLNASLAIIDGTAQDAMKVKEMYTLLTSEFYFHLLESSEESGLIKNKNVQDVCPIILSGGKDITLPLIDIKNNIAQVDGLALFTEDKMTGRLSTEESSVFLLLSDQITDRIRFNFKVDDRTNNQEKNYVNFVVRKSKRKLKVTAEEEQVKVAIDLSLRIEIDEFATDSLYDESIAIELENKIKENFTELIDNTIVKIQKANSDVFGIGDRLRAYHPKTWEKLSWREEYSNIPIETKVNVEIVRYGIIN